MPSKPPLRRFVLLVFLLIIPLFAIWTMTSTILALPAIGLDHLILTAWLPDIVNSVTVRGAEALVVTNFGEANGQIVTAERGEEMIAFLVDTRLLSYSLPFYASLHFANPRNNSLGDFILGIIVLYALFVFGLVSMSLKDLMVTLGASFLEHPEALVPSGEAIGLLYQFNVLIVPALSPILLWAWQNRDSALLRGVAGKSVTDS